MSSPSCSFTVFLPLTFCPSPSLVNSPVPQSSFSPSICATTFILKLFAFAVFSIALASFLHYLILPLLHPVLRPSPQVRPLSSFCCLSTGTSNFILKYCTPTVPYAILSSLFSNLTPPFNYPSAHLSRTPHPLLFPTAHVPYISKSPHLTSTFLPILPLPSPQTSYSLSLISLLSSSFPCSRSTSTSQHIV